MMTSPREQDRLLLLIACRRGILSREMARQAYQRRWETHPSPTDQVTLRTSLTSVGLAPAIVDDLLDWWNQGFQRSDGSSIPREDDSESLVELMGALDLGADEAEITSTEPGLSEPVGDPLATQLPPTLPPSATESSGETLPPAAGLKWQDPIGASGQHSNWARPRMRYDVLEPLASGGLGEVLVASDNELNREVALKQIRGQWADDENARQRFLLEAEVTGKLEHPGVVPVYGLGVYEDGRPYYAMRLIDGESLLEATSKFHARFGAQGDQSERTTAFRKLLSRLIDVCQTIEYAHSRAVLHRDLKPDNIMLGPYGETLVVDWGLAKHLDQMDQSSEPPLEKSSRETSQASWQSDATEHGSVVGTPAYMSPEQASGRIADLTPRSDVYSLGATLHFMLTGKTRLDLVGREDGESVSDYVARLASTPVEPAHHITSTAPKPLAAIAAKATAFQPAERYESAQAMADDIERYLADEPVVAFPDPWTTTARRWIKRHQTLASSTIAVVMASTLGLLVFLSLLSAKQRELEFSNQQLDVALQEARDAAMAAELGRMQANEAKANELAFSRFLVHNILAVARPLGMSGGLGIDVKLIDAIVEAEADLEEVFAGRPLAEATARSGLGDTWHTLGEFQKAADHHRRAAEIFRSQIGVDSAEYWISMSELALALKMLGQIDKAMQIQVDALEALSQIEGPAAPATLSAMNNLGLTQVIVGRSDDGLRTLEMSLAMTREEHGDRSPEALASMDNLAEALRLGSDEQRQRAIELLQVVIPAKQEVLGELHPETLSSINNYATMLMEFGQSELAIETLRETATEMRDVLGEKHLRVIVTETNLAFAMAEDGRFDDAVSQLRSTIDRSQAGLGEFHPATLNAQDILGNVYSAMGDSEAATEELLSVVRGRRQVLGDDHAETLKSMNNLAYEYQVSGQITQAIPLYEDVLRGRRELLSNDDPRLLISINNLASAYADAGQPSEAETLYRELLEYLRDNEDRDEYWRVRNNLADCYLQLGEPERAISIYQEQLEEYVASQTDGPLVEITRQSLAVALLQLQRYDEALPLLVQMVNQQRKLVDESPQHRSLLRGMLVYLAECHLGLGQFEAAESAAEESRSIALETMPDNWRRYNAQSLLGEALMEQGEVERAKALLEEAHPFIVNDSTDMPMGMRAGFVEASFRRMIKLAEVQQDSAAAERLRMERNAFFGDVQAP